MNRILIYLLLISAGALSWTCNRSKDMPSTSRQTSNTLISTAMQPDTRWATIDSLEEQGLYRSAWDMTNLVYDDARESGDYQTQYKALCYRLKYAARVEDGSELQAIAELQKLADEADMPLKAIAQSMSAEAYWTYYQQNQWKIMGRTPAPGVVDIAFWDAGRFVDAIDDAYTASLSQAELLTSVRIEDLSEELISERGQVELRPTLFELLAYRALGFYQNQ